jgi:hypothetical protein
MVISAIILVGSRSPGTQALSISLSTHAARRAVPRRLDPAPFEHAFHRRHAKEDGITRVLGAMPISA